ncbi:MAG: hypothetical protein M3134_03795, partial [Actinomycetota bacterium]|nr:hypothetical protein [Actinomycetota bacterium]
MNDVEAALTAMLAGQAERIDPAPGHRSKTLRGARRRRVVNAVAAGVASVAVIGGGIGAATVNRDAPV